RARQGRPDPRDVRSDHRTAARAHAQHDRSGAGQSPEKRYTKIDKLLLVGGSTYMPQVIDTVKAKFPFEVRQFDPNQAVAKGAALFGYKCYLDEQIKINIAEQTGQAPEQVEVEKIEAKVIEKAQGEVARAHGLALP